MRTYCHDIPVLMEYQNCEMAFLVLFIGACEPHYLFFFFHSFLEPTIFYNFSYIFFQCSNYSLALFEISACFSSSFYLLLPSFTWFFPFPPPSYPKLSNLGSTSSNFSILHLVLENCFGLFLGLDCSRASQLLLLQVGLSYQVSPPKSDSSLQIGQTCSLENLWETWGFCTFVGQNPLPFICHCTHSH